MACGANLRLSHGRYILITLDETSHPRRRGADVVFFALTGQALPEVSAFERTLNPSFPQHCAAPAHS
jgi:hypothetical protein